MSYFLRSPQSVNAHCGGINALCLSGDSTALYTASRDATVRAPAPLAAPRTCYTRPPSVAIHRHCRPLPRTRKQPPGRTRRALVNRPPRCLGSSSSLFQPSSPTRENLPAGPHLGPQGRPARSGRRARGAHGLGHRRVRPGRRSDRDGLVRLHSSPLAREGPGERPADGDPAGESRRETYPLVCLS